MDDYESAQAAIVNSQDMTFVPIQSGSFMMGSPESEPARYNDEPLHEVTLSRGFYMQTTPVTVGQWSEFVDATDFKTQAELEGGARGLWGGSGALEEEWKIDPAFTWKSPGFSQTNDHPVTCVSMHDIEVFIAWLNGQNPQKYRLPTEAEWEYACRAGSNTIFAYGDCLSIADTNFNDAVNPIPGCKSSGVFKKCTIPVSQCNTNRWGLHGMHGNVMEWCQDQCGWDEQKEELICDTYVDGIVDPLSKQGTVFIARGGSWSADAKHSRAACRIKYEPDERWTFLGFRLVLSAA